MMFFCDVSATFCGHSPPPCSPTVGSWCGSLLTDEPCDKRCVFDETCVDNRSGFFLDVFEGSCAKIKSGFRCRFDMMMQGADVAKRSIAAYACQKMVSVDCYNA